jgi:hypothetical protein
MAVSDTAARIERQVVRNPYSVLPNWLYPTFVVVILGAFIVYATYVVFTQPAGYYEPYLSPFDSPWIKTAIPPGIFVAWAPLAFRLTCYYYRKAYFRSFLWHPRSCAVPEPGRGRYRGETAFPWVLNNFHRFAFYATVVQVVFLWYDAVVAFDFHGRFGIGAGTVLMLVNVVLLSGYTFGCHAFRHLAGGELNCFSCSRSARARFQLWKGVTVLNIRHDRWAWASLFSVWLTDVFIRALMNHWAMDLRWIS